MATNTTLPIINGTTTENCTAISPLCPVDQTTYGYYPSLGANAFFCAIFAICCIANVVQGIKFKTWTYMIALGLGSLTEAIGYIGRIIMHGNPWSSTGFEIQICCLILAPAFVAAGIYLTLKHCVIELGPSFSRLRPNYYTWIFISCDILSLVLQGVGGGIAASGKPGSSSTKVGTDLMITGVVWQVCTLLGFGSLVADYVFRCSKNTLAPSGYRLLGTLRFKLFISGLVLAYFTVFTRCVYRIAELSPGWGNPIMQNEAEFIVLDGVMVTVATICLTVFHPGTCFKEMQLHAKNTPAVDEKIADVEASPSHLVVAGHPGYFGSIQ
ncbi:hypothetical protein P7C71_g2571, partial [Lecanoromycetidae sp. Uapishka_2]